MHPDRYWRRMKIRERFLEKMRLQRAVERLPFCERKDKRAINLMMASTEAEKRRFSQA